MDQLDDKLRAAMQALEASATPRGYFDELGARIERRMEGSMQTDADRAGSTASPPPTTAAADRADEGVVERTEDSGAHDIKALARSTRQRISRRQTSQHEVDDSMLSSSQSGMHAIALPDPAKMIALPTPEEARALSASMSMSSLAVAAEETGGSQVRGAVAREPVVESRARASSKGVPVWLWAGGAVAVAAAAAVAFVMMGKDDAEPKGAGDRVAAADTRGSSEELDEQLAAREAEPAAPSAAQDAVTVTGVTTPDEATGAGSGSGSGSEMSGSGAIAEVAGDKPSDSDGEADPKSRTKKSAGSGSSSGSSSTKKDDAKGKDDLVADKGDVKDPPPPPDGGDKGSGKGSSKGSGKGSGTGTAGGAVLGDGDSDELGIGDAIKGGGGGGGDDKPKKTELTSKELRAGLDAVSGKAKACYDGAVGTVKVKLTVASSGTVSKASATGDLAGTPAATCVVAAIKGASFPAWTGAPMSTTYAVLLSD